jgi:hypothetical protein
MVITDRYKRTKLNTDVMGMAIHHNIVDSKIIILVHYQKDIRPDRVLIWTLNLPIKHNKIHLQYSKTISSYLASEYYKDHGDKLSKPLITASRMCTNAVRVGENLIIDSLVCKE